MVMNSRIGESNYGRLYEDERKGRHGKSCLG